MVRPRYLWMFLACLLAWLTVYFLFVLTVDPYGVSPLEVTSKGFNSNKPKRLDIDRQIKPFEVWKKQPRTVFLGTSRIHQSIDPSLLDGTRFAPAYNAAIPASTLQLNLSHIRTYINQDPALKTVVVELFFSHFLDYHNTVALPEGEPHGLTSIARDSGTLFASGDALLASLQTLYHNSVHDLPCTEIKPGGYISYAYDKRLFAKNSYDGFVAPHGIWKTHGDAIHAGNQFKLQETAFAAVEKMAGVCKDHGVELLFILTPTSAEHDYYFDVFGAKELVTGWLKRVSGVAEVYAIALPGDVVYEPVQANGMRYWYDPIHFSMETGGMILDAIAGIRTGRTSATRAIRLIPGAIEEYVEFRDGELKRWVGKNPDFVWRFEQGRRSWAVKNVIEQHDRSK